MPPDFNPYYTWLGIPPAEQPPHHYRLLGIVLFEQDADVIANAADQRMAHLRTFQSGRHSAHSQRLLNEVSSAKVQLLTPQRKAAYDRALRGSLQLAAPPISAEASGTRLGSIAAPNVAPQAVPIAAQPAVPIAVQPSAAPVATQSAYDLGLDADSSSHPKSKGGSSRRHTSRKPKSRSPNLSLMVMGGGVLVMAIGLAVVLAFKPSDDDRTVKSDGPRRVATTAGNDEHSKSPQPEPAEEPSTPIVDESSSPDENPQPGVPDEPVAKPDPTAQPIEPPAVTEPSTKPESEPIAGPTEPVAPEPPKTDPPMQERIATSENPEATAPPPDQPRESGPIQPRTLTSSSGSGTKEPDTSAGKLPVPSADELKTSKDQIKDVFKTEIAAAVKPEEKIELAKLLMRHSNDARDEPATRFALLTQTKQLAIEAGDSGLALDAIAILAGSYQVDALKLRSAALIKLGKSVRTNDGRLSVASVALDLVDEASGKNDWESAAGLAGLAQGLAVKVHETALAKQAAARVAEVKKLEQEWSAVQPAIETLKTAPDDAAANAKYGRYLCIARGDWSTGLPLLAKSDNVTLAPLCKLELENPKEPAGQAKIADAWWEIAEKEKGTSRDPFYARARYWYELAEPGLTGLTQTHASKRLKEIYDSHSGGSDVKNAKFFDFVLGPGVQIRMRKVPAGRFVMGVANSRDQHTVTITKPFLIGITEVTQAQWLAVMKNNPSSASNMPDNPVENVSWNTCLQFINVLAQTPAGRRFHLRLPTEAEWEYACRGGSTGEYCYGDDSQMLREFGWCSLNGGNRTHPVGQLKPNALGLFDMHGNVEEWVSDAFGSFDLNTPAIDPTGPPGGSRVFRGGAYLSEPSGCKSGNRNYQEMNSNFFDVGFRLAGDVPGAVSKKPVVKAGK